MNALQSRTELESLMRMCLDDVKQDIMRQRSRSGEEGGLAGGVAAMGREDRMKVHALSFSVLCAAAVLTDFLFCLRVSHPGFRCWSCCCRRSALFLSSTTARFPPACLSEASAASQIS